MVLASADGKLWVQLHHEPSCPFQGPFSARFFPVAKNAYYRYFRYSLFVYSYYHCCAIIITSGVSYNDVVFA